MNSGHLNLTDLYERIYGRAAISVPIFFMPHC